jgi:hypothetical protein
MVADLTDVGQRRIYTFDASARSSIGVQSIIDQCNGMTWSVFDPSGNRLGIAPTCTDQPRIDLASSGSHTVVVDSNGSTGAYDLTLVRIPADVVEDVPADGRMTDEITTIGARHTYRFDAESGTVVQLGSESGSCGSLVYSLTDTDGTRRGIAPVCSPIGEITLQQTGQFSIHIDASYGTGTYEVTLDPVP